MMKKAILTIGGLLLSFNVLFAQAPTISYSSPQSFTVGTAITPLAPTSTVVAATAYSGTPVSIGSGLGSPGGVAVDAAANVYLVDYISHAVTMVPAGGGSTVTISPGFVAPQDVTVDAAGNVYVANYLNNAQKKSFIPAVPLLF